MNIKKYLLLHSFFSFFSFFSLLSSYSKNPSLSSILSLKQAKLISNINKNISGIDFRVSNEELEKEVMQLQQFYTNKKKINLLIMLENNNIHMFKKMELISINKDIFNYSNKYGYNITSGGLLKDWE